MGLNGGSVATDSGKQDFVTGFQQTKVILSHHASLCTTGQEPLFESGEYVFSKRRPHFLSSFLFQEKNVRGIGPKISIFSIQTSSFEIMFSLLKQRKNPCYSTE
jgi:hypothetical protein